LEIYSEEMPIVMTKDDDDGDNNDSLCDLKPPPSSVEVKERLELYLYSTSGPSWSVIE